MGQVTASYRRVFQVRPYETETVELSVTDECALVGAMLVEAAAKLHDDLARVGDDAVVMRMASAPVRVGNDSKVERKGDPWAR